MSIDAFISSFAYAASNIKIPFKSIIIINIIGSLILAISLFLGSVIFPFIPVSYSKAISFIILFTLGITKIFDTTIKTLIRKYINTGYHKSKKVKFYIFNLQFILDIYANPEKADIDSSKTVSSKESIYLAIALALDSFAVGFGAGLSNVNHIQLVVLSLLTGMVALVSGVYIGGKISQKLSLNLSWLSGVILVVLAFSNI